MSGTYALSRLGQIKGCNTSTAGLCHAPALHEFTSSSRNAQALSWLMTLVADERLAPHNAPHCVVSPIATWVSEVTVNGQACKASPRTSAIKPHEQERTNESLGTQCNSNGGSGSTE